jgi:hypothetical protein
MGKKINSRVKGASFERKIAGYLSDWWGFQFRRVPLSGGYDKRFVVGDLWIADGAASIEDIRGFPFSIEAKNREAWNWDCLFGYGNKGLVGYWKQAQDDARCLDKIPLLIITRNRAPIYVFWDSQVLKPSESQGYILFRMDENVVFGVGCLAVAKIEDWVKMFPKEKVIRQLQSRH